METFIYRGALYCSDCGTQIGEESEAKGVEDNGDSDTFPQGPYDDGGGEADTPQHCGRCGEFLGNALTDDGYSYVIDEVQDALAHSRVNSVAVQQWAPYYGVNFEDDFARPGASFGFN